VKYLMLSYALCIVFSARIIIARPAPLGRSKKVISVSFLRTIFEIVFFLPLMNRETGLVIAVLVLGMNLLESVVLRATTKRGRDTDGNAIRFLFSITSTMVVCFISSFNIDFGLAPWVKVFYQSISACFRFSFLESIEPASLSRIFFSFAGFLFSVFLLNDGILFLLNKYQITGSSEIPPSEKTRKNIKRGKVIGVLERAVLYLLMFTGDYSSIGFVLAAKTLVRFKELEDNKDFAEYFLIGTLASLGGTISVLFLLQLINGV